MRFVDGVRNRPSISLCDTLSAKNVALCVASAMVRKNNYLLTPWSRVLFEKPTGFQLVKKFPAFYVTQRFPMDDFRFLSHRRKL